MTEGNYEQGLIRDIYEVATRDPLTCLPGRKYMEACLEEEMEVFRRTGRPFAVFFADVNDFHAINNTYGHETGDAILHQFGLTLRKFGRKTDKFCRWGGDEFVGLLQLRSPKDIKGAARRFMQLADGSEVTVNGQKVSCQTSFGITVVREGDDIKSLVARADTYMYQAKKRTDVRIFTDFDAKT